MALELKCLVPEAGRQIWAGQGMAEATTLTSRLIRDAFARKANNKFAPAIQLPFMGGPHFADPRLLPADCAEVSGQPLGMDAFDCAEMSGQPSGTDAFICAEVSGHAFPFLAFATVTHSCEPNSSFMPFLKFALRLPGRLCAPRLWSTGCSRRAGPSPGPPGV